MLGTPNPDRPTLTVVAGVSLGAVFRVSAETRLGRSGQCHVRISHPNVSRIHAKIIREDDGRYFVLDQGARNGTTVGGKPVTRHELKDGDRIGLGQDVYFRFAFATANEEESARYLYESATMDGLTQAVNRRFFEHRLQEELAFANRHTAPISLLLLDIDFFKSVNDKHGHQVGDYVLETMSAAIRTTLRGEDIFARYGGEEFAIVARGIDLWHATVLAERIRMLVQRTPFAVQGTSIPVTVSVGIASMACCGPSATMEQLIEAADRRLYLAKASGRNRCVGDESRVSLRNTMS